MCEILIRPNSYSCRNEKKQNKTMRICAYDVCARNQIKRKVFLHSPGMSSMLEMPLSLISTSRRFLSRLSSTIFFKDFDILAGNWEQRIRSDRQKNRSWSQQESETIRPTYQRLKNENNLSVLMKTNLKCFQLTPCRMFESERPFLTRILPVSTGTGTAKMCTL